MGGFRGLAEVLSAGDGMTGGDGRGAAKRGSQAYLGLRALAAPGDMMIDRVSPPAGMRPLSLFRPSACPARQEQPDSRCGSWPRLCPIC
jgi:hypothetical protein